MTTFYRTSAFTIFTAVILLPGGCGSDSKKLATVPVTGKLTFKDPKKGPIPAAGALVVFNPVPEDQKNLYYPQGTVKEDGTFVLTTYTDGDGAPVGEYGVTILWKAKSNSPIGGEDRGQGADFLGRRYADPKAPRIKQTVTASGPNQFEITIE